MDNVSTMSKDTDGEENGQGWQAPKSKKSKKPKKVLVATRTGSRVQRDGVLIATKAANRVMERNNMTGTTQNSFTIPNNTPNSFLQSVIADLDLEIDNMDEQLDVFKAEEMARAKIAEANYNSFLEKQNQKTAPKTVEDEKEYTMEVISNQHREFSSVSSMGGGDCAESSAAMGELLEHIPP